MPSPTLPLISGSSLASPSGLVSKETGLVCTVTCLVLYLRHSQTISYTMLSFSSSPTQKCDILSDNRAESQGWSWCGHFWFLQFCCGGWSRANAQVLPHQTKLWLNKQTLESLNGDQWLLGMSHTPIAGSWKRKGLIWFWVLPNVQRCSKIKGTMTLESKAIDMIDMSGLESSR